MKKKHLESSWKARKEGADQLLCKAQKLIDGKYCSEIDYVEFCDHMYMAEYGTALYYAIQMKKFIPKPQMTEYLDLLYKCCARLKLHRNFVKEPKFEKIWTKKKKLREDD